MCERYITSPRLTREKVPLHKLRGVPNPNRPAFDDLPKHSGAPVRTERLAKPRLRLLHLLARPCLAEDAYDTVAEPEEFAARFSERDAAKHHIRAAFRRIDIDARFRGGVAPCSFIDD